MHTQTITTVFTGLHAASRALGCIPEHEHSHEYAVAWHFGCGTDDIDHIDGSVLTDPQVDRLVETLRGALREHAQVSDERFVLHLDESFAFDPPMPTTPTVLAAVLYAMARFVSTAVVACDVRQGSAYNAMHAATFAATWPEPVPAWAARAAARVLGIDAGRFNVMPDHLAADALRGL